MPSTSVRLATFEPMMLPTAMSSLPCVEAMPDTTISGALVPKPTTTAPMITGGTFSAADRRAAPATNVVGGLGEQHEADEDGEEGEGHGRKVVGSDRHGTNRRHEPPEQQPGRAVGGRHDRHDRTPIRFRETGGPEVLQWGTVDARRPRARRRSSSATRPSG